MALRRLSSSGSSTASSLGGRMNLKAMVEMRSEEKAELRRPDDATLRERIDGRNGEKNRSVREGGL